MKRKLMSVLLAAALTIGLSVPAMAAEYSDLNGHWAQAYMEDLAARGYLSGYGDGTMGPDDPITAGQTLVLLSRLYSPNDDTMTWIYSQYEDFITDEVPSSLSWAYEGLALCLAAGIVTKEELVNMDLTGKIEKEDLVLFTVRAMQKADVVPDTKLTFADTADIAEADQNAVALLVEEGIVTGGDNNKFQPHASVTRAVAATIVSRVLTYLTTENQTLTLKGYENLTTTQGTIYSAVSGVLQLRTDEGLIREYTVPSTAKVTVGGTAKTLSALYNGYRATVTEIGGAVAGVAIVSSSDTTWTQGTLASVYSASGSQYIYLTDSASGDQQKYTIPTGATVTLDGKTTTVSGLKAGEFALVTVQNSAVTAVTAATASRDITGTISALNYGTTVTFKLTEESGAVWYFPLDIANLPSILRGQTAISIDRLSVGDTVTATVAAGKITTIVAGGSTQDTLTGELTAIITTASGTTWVIKDDNGSSQALTVEENAGVYKGSTAILLSAINVGDRVTVSLYGNSITEITLESAVSSSSKITGTVLAVDTSAKTITVLVSEKLVYISTSGVGAIVNAATGDTMKLSSIAVNSTLVAYGSYTNSTNFQAVAIVVES